MSHGVTIKLPLLVVTALIKSRAAKFDKCLFSGLRTTWNSLHSDIRACGTVSTFKLTHQNFKTTCSDSRNLKPPAPLLPRTLGCYTNVILLLFLGPLVLHSQGIKIKQIGEISGMVTLRTRKLEINWPGILSKIAESQSRSVGREKWFPVDQQCLVQPSCQSPE